jgi:predicted ABC-type ATPase
MPSTPTLHLIAGVNGAGKTTFYYRVLKESTPGAEFVNADEIARTQWPGLEEEHAAEAARLAGKRREELLEARLSFVAETVFSHPSKLELIETAKSRGFRVILYHVGVSSAELARARVDTRVETGGHSVPPDKVAARYERTQHLIPRAAQIAERTFVFDNSGNAGTKTLTHVMTIIGGRIMSLAEDVPAWVEDAYVDLLAAYRRERR